MNRKILTMALASLLLAATTAEAQSIEKALDKMAKDPKTAENAARADVYIMGHKISNDSAQHQKSQPAVKTKKKKERCRKPNSQ